METMKDETRWKRRGTTRGESSEEEKKMLAVPRVRVLLRRIMYFEIRSLKTGKPKKKFIKTPEGKW